jgi:hypothetical protein
MYENTAFTEWVGHFREDVFAFMQACAESFTIDCQEITRSTSEAPFSFALSATSQQYFSLKTNQPTVLFSQKKPTPAITQTNRLVLI